MMKIADKHYKLTQSKNIVFKENKSKISFLNKNYKPCYRVQVDGGVISDRTTAKCDNLLVVSYFPEPDIDKREQEHFVELKGTDVAHALNQLVDTVPKLRCDDKKVKRCAYVVCKNVAPAIKTKIQNAKLLLKKKDNCELHIGEHLEPKL
ncbi:hypothetical protein E5358_14405 [Palleniella muris]|uniref:Uncharacterized protein n=1 Tax=Palleniella muris TaxID=3038145 RepID=A0AC61QLN1_9BACT|nr:hypothetical protein [Palleniella muris]TGX79823.1 hypothetical protein E5358_14405 [Palleniella muris]